MAPYADHHRRGEGADARAVGVACPAARAPAPPADGDPRSCERSAAYCFRSPDHHLSNSGRQNGDAPPGAWRRRGVRYRSPIRTGVALPRAPPVPDPCTDLCSKRALADGPLRGIVLPDVRRHAAMCPGPQAHVTVERAEWRGPARGGPGNAGRSRAAQSRGDVSHHGNHLSVERSDDVRKRRIAPPMISHAPARVCRRPRDARTERLGEHRDATPRAPSL